MSRFPVKSLSAVLLLTIVLMGGMAWQLWRSYQTARDFQDRDARLLELRGTIAHLDEALTMSARMAAASGNLEWEKRYRSFEGPLDEAIHSVIKLAPYLNEVEGANQTDQANQRLVEMEDRSFELVKSHRQPEAAALLMSPEYQNQKRIYAEGMHRTMSVMSDRIKQRLAEQRQRALIAVAAMTVAFPVLLGVWWLVLRSARHHLHERAQQENLLREAQAKLEQANLTLEARVKERTGQLEEAHRSLLEAARSAGMAEVATGVLHNVGNALNSVNMSANVVGQKLRQNHVASFGKAAQMLKDHESDLGAFFTSDKSGQKLPKYLIELAGHLSAGQASMLDEVTNLVSGIEHIKQIVGMQQSYARGATMVERVRPADAMESALALNVDALSQRHIQIDRDYDELAEVELEKHKLLQVLTNLISNARHAVKSNDTTEKRITLRVKGVDQSGQRNLRFVVEDNGVGIAPENLTRIFTHGFTTRKDGHGFGLHSAANLAAQMGGSIRVSSDGRGKGATFTVEIPVHLREAAACKT